MADEFKIKITNKDLPGAPKYSWVGIMYDHYTCTDAYRFFITTEKRAYIFTEDDMTDPIFKLFISENNYTFQKVPLDE